MNIFIETHGCDINLVTTEIIAKKLIDKGHKLSSKEDADLIIINSCALNKENQRKILKSIKESNETLKKILVVGCLPEIDSKSIEDISPNISYAGTSSLSYLDEIIENISEDMVTRRKEDIPRTLIKQDKISLNSVSFNLPISEGCSNNCTFCVEPFTYGTHVSYEPDEIIIKAHEALNKNYKEINLIGNELASYGLDNSTKLPSLLRKLTTLPGEFKIKLGVMNPGNLLKILDDLMLSMSSNKVYKYIELPLQSGSNEILKRMNRNYTAEEFKLIISKLRQKFPNITISTDVMLGFPGESDEDYVKTKRLIEEVKPDILNIYVYSKMPFTKSPESDVLSWKTKNRMIDLKSSFERIQSKKMKENIGLRGSALVTGHFNTQYSLARTDNYLPVLINRSNPGEKVQIEIINSEGDYYIGM